MTLLEKHAKLFIPKQRPRYRLWEYVRVTADLEDYVFDTECQIIGIAWGTESPTLESWWYYIRYVKDYPEGCVKRGQIDVAEERELLPLDRSFQRRCYRYRRLRRVPVFTTLLKAEKHRSSVFQ